jgi:DNA-binding transcriptional MocR family regulator
VEQVESVRGTAELSAATLLATIDAHSPAGRQGFRALAAAIASAVQAGDVPSGARLPTERALAAAAGVARGTVVGAYELLREDGLVIRRQGAGTWVRVGALPGPSEPTEELAAALRARRLTARVLGDDVPGVVDLGLSALHEPWQLDPTWFATVPAELAVAGRGHGYLPNGLPELRSAVAERLSGRGLDATAERVAVTAGAQHAISLAARLLVHPGDTVVVESPTFPGAIDALARAGARFVSVGTDSGGTRLDELERLLSAGDVRAVYTVPSCHSPTGSVMATGRRRELAAMVARAGAWLIEDETLASLRFEGPVSEPVAAHAASERHVVLGSLAKEVWGGLRVGWMWGPRVLVDRLARLRAATDLGAPVHAQLVALACLDGLDARTDALRSELARRARHLCDLVEAALPEWSCTRPDGGLSLWCRLPAPVGDRLSSWCVPFGVAVLAGSSTTVDDRGRDHVRLSFAASPEQLELGVERLAEAWASMGGAWS